MVVKSYIRILVKGNKEKGDGGRRNEERGTRYEEGTKNEVRRRNEERGTRYEGGTKNEVRGTKEERRTR
jgi:hypothetical protein